MEDAVSKVATTHDCFIKPNYENPFEKNFSDNSSQLETTVSSNSNISTAIFLKDEVSLMEKTISTTNSEKKEISPPVWRDSKEDGYILVRNYSCGMKEKKKEELKDWSVDFDKVVSNNINTFIEKYLPKSYVYYPAENIYMLVKKYDDNRKIYVCKAKDDPN